MGYPQSLNGADDSAKLASVVNGFIQKQGGVTGVISQFEKQGLGVTAQSWAGKGENHPISVAQIFRALGYGTLQQLGGQLGLTPDETAVKLSQALPEAISKSAAAGNRVAAPAPTIWSYFVAATR